MNIFLTGATGYIGSVVAEKLQAAGHSVIGLARSDAAAQKLQDRSIAVQRGDLNDPESLRRTAQDADAVIHTAATSGPDMPQTDTAAIDAIVSALEGTSKPFLYTSGVWVYGNTGDTVADEETPLHPLPIVAWRPANEQKVLASADRGVRAIVIRPGIVYGRGGSIPAMLVQSGREQGVVRYIGDGENRWPDVHVDDLAELYRLALENAPARTVLNGVGNPVVRVRDIAEAASVAAGIPGRTETWSLEAARQALGPFADALALDQQISGAKARQLLGWTPQGPALLDDLARGSYAR